MSQGKRYKFRGSTFQVVTAWGVATTGITAITKANPAVVTKAAHGLVDGDIVKLSAIGGMVELNDQIFVVEQLSTDTFALIGVDSTLYNSFTTAGSFQKATLSGSCEVTNYSGPSGSTSESETETNCGKAVDFGSPDPGSVTLGFHMAPNDFQNALEAARRSVSDIILKTTIAGGGGVMYDKGVITQTQRDGSPSGPWTGGATLRRTVERIDLVL